MDIHSFDLFALWFPLEKADGPDMSLFREEDPDFEPKAIAELARRLLSAQIPHDMGFGARRVENECRKWLVEQKP